MLVVSGDELRLLVIADSHMHNLLAAVTDMLAGGDTTRASMVWLLDSVAEATSSVVLEGVPRRGAVRIASAPARALAGPELRAGCGRRHEKPIRRDMDLSDTSYKVYGPNHFEI
jgi:hypothetical protein